VAARARGGALAQHVLHPLAQQARLAAGEEERADGAGAAAHAQLSVLPCNAVVQRVGACRQQLAQHAQRSRRGLAALWQAV
jgi:hypothetical protein